MRTSLNPEVFQAWSEFLCISDAYFEDSASKLVEPQCQMLIERISEYLRHVPSDSKDTTLRQNHPIFTISNTITSILCHFSSRSSLMIEKSSGKTAALRLPAGLRQLSFDKTSTEVQINPVTSCIPLFLTEVFSFLVAPKCPEGYLARQLLNHCASIYTSNPHLIIYSVLESLGDVVNDYQEYKFIVDSPFKALFTMSNGPFALDICKHMSLCFKNMKDLKNDAYSKLSMEAYFTAIYYMACNTRDDDSNDFMALLMALNKDVLLNFTRYRSVIYLILVSFMRVADRIAELRKAAETSKEYRDCQVNRFVPGIIRVGSSFSSLGYVSRTSSQV